MSSLQLLKLAELGRNLLASKRKTLVVATGCLFASGTMAYMYYRNQHRSTNHDCSDNDTDGENRKEKMKRNDTDNKSSEERRNTKGELKSLQILAAFLVSKIGPIRMQKLYALLTRAVPRMLQFVHCDVLRIECSSQEGLENHKTGKYREANEEQLHGSLMPESENVSNVSKADNLKIVDVPSKNSQKENSLRAQVDVESMKSKLIERKAKLENSLMPASGNELGSSAEDLKIVEKPNMYSQINESLGAQVAVETTERNLIGRKSKEHEHQGSLMPAYANESVGLNTDNLNIIEMPNKKPQKKKSLGAEVDVETMKRKLIEGGVAADALRVCTLCNVVCNSDVVLHNHITGQKHAKMLKILEDAGAVQSPKGDVCNIECSSQDVMENHNTGNNHDEKQLHDSLMPASESDPFRLTKKRSRRRKRVVEQGDLKTTKIKSIEKGVAEDALKVCTVCNIVCPSESVFNSHIAGQRHARMLKKQDFPNNN